MRDRHVRWITTVAVALLLAPAALRAQDLTLKNTTTANGKETAGVQYISPTATRTSTGADTDVIVRLDQKKFYTINMKQKTYSEMTFDDMQKMVQSAANATDQMPPEAAAMMKKMGMGGGGDVTLTPGGPGETIAGYATEKYHLTMGTMMEIDLWAAPSLKFPPMQWDAMKAAMPANPMLDMKKLFEAYKKINGVPLKTVSTMKMMGREMTSTTVVTAVEKTPIPAATFDVPAGFKLVAMGGK